MNNEDLKLSRLIVQSECEDNERLLNVIHKANESSFYTNYTAEPNWHGYYTRATKPFETRTGETVRLLFIPYADYTPVVEQERV